MMVVVVRVSNPRPNSVNVVLWQAALPGGVIARPAAPSGTGPG